MVGELTDQPQEPTERISASSSGGSEGWLPRRREVAAWLALAASLLFVVISGRELAPRDDSPRGMLASLIADGEKNPSQLTRVAWSEGPDAAGEGATGEVVWHNDRQQGVMRFTGLATNNPEESQYQLWIFDATRDERHPVDGGVFDIPPGDGEVLIPIDARLPVAEPTLFAITVERPGGVVVSSRERLPLLAQVER